MGGGPTTVTSLEVTLFKVTLFLSQNKGNAVSNSTENSVFQNEASKPKQLTEAKCAPNFLLAQLLPNTPAFYPLSSVLGQSEK